VTAAGAAVSVVVPSHARRIRLRWLLNALEAQTLPRERWEVVVVHTYDAEDARNVLDRHPLAAGGTLRHERIAPDQGSPARQRNLGWRAARAPLVAFTDDDCRPDPAWLEGLLDAAERAPGDIVQGATRADPLDHAIWAAPHTRSLHVDPPGPFAQTCNILYPRALLERLGGFDERFPGPAGEDVDLALRAQALGVRVVGAPVAVVFHAVEEHTLPQMVRLNLKWADMAYLVKRHPQVRRDYPLRIFWRREHFLFCLALLGAGSARRLPPLALLGVPYLRWALGRRGRRKKARLACVVELPGRVVVDAAEVATLAYGSVKHRTLVL
jgi:glycosyltransferase involved in cell wall biosynthesis